MSFELRKTLRGSIITHQQYQAKLSSNLAMKADSWADYAISHTGTLC